MRSLSIINWYTHCISTCPWVQAGNSRGVVKPVPVWWNFEFWSLFNLSIYILECPLDCKEVKPVNPKGNQSWIFFGWTDAEAETPTLWPPEAKNWLIGKDPDARKDWGREEKGETEDDIVGWHHWLNEIREQTQGDTEGQGSLECCSSCGCKSVGHDLGTEQQLSWN